MKMVISDTAKEMGLKAAEEAAAFLRERIDRQGGARIVLSTGASQFEFMEAFVTMDVDWSKVEMFHLDEYVALPETHPASFRKYLKERFLEKVPVGQFHLVDGEGDVERNIAALSEEIRKRPVDLALIGIGENAHIAFNDPPADFQTKAAYIVVDLAPACKTQQVREGWFPTMADVPQQAITMTVHQIMQSEKIISVVPREVKAAAIAATLKDDSVSPDVPASILKTHRNWSLYLDRLSAAIAVPNSSGK